MKSPVEPNKEDCCNSGCNPCIFDIYEKQLVAYKKSLENGTSYEFQENAISQIVYGSFVLVYSIQLCDSHKLLVLQRNESNNHKVWWKAGDHFLMRYSNENVNCTRAYTPLKICPMNECTGCDFALIVKRYTDGLVSNYLYNLKPGDITEWRGPYGHYEVIPNRYKRLIMIAQGTGIAPFISIIQEILRNEDDLTKMVLYYCCPSEEKILLREELYSFLSYWNFSYKIFLNDSSQVSNSKYREPVLNHKLTVNDLSFLKPFTINDQYLLCGSEQFSEYYNMLFTMEGVSPQNIVIF